ncbi:MAG: hypothetical protein KDA45_13335, partial [Planctomycetales bacterium]|nr:hypothetical protein [Planctomycetales bacterium]
MDHDRKTLELGVGSRLLFRDWLDWLFAAAVLGLSPLLWLHCQDLWFRTDLLFFPLLLLVFVALAVRVSRSAWSEAPLQCGPTRSRFAVALLIVACLAALSASLLFSPWLAWLALLLVSNAWLLVRLQALNWYRAVGCTLPLGVFLVLPLSDAADASRTLESWTAFSASALLDLFGVPQLATHDGLELRGGLLPMAAICAGMGNPYFLFSLAVLLVMWRSRSFLVGLLTVASVPAWAWLGAVVQAVGGAALWDKQDIYLFGGGRKVVVQLAVLLALLLMIWLFHWAVQKLLSPFTAYSATFAGIHKFFNRAVLWPARDPLRRRTESSRKAPAGAGLLDHRHAS